MRLFRKYRVPANVALLYDFANSLDLRRFVHRGVRHVMRDELATPRQLAAWMVARDLLKHGSAVTKKNHDQALRLREALRALLQRNPRARRGDRSVTKTLEHIAADFPLLVDWDEGGNIGLRPARWDGVGGLGAVLSELEHAAASNELDRLKMCAAAECGWVFYDRSKPRSRRWCVSSLCGNREKTRAYRRRRKQHKAL